MASRYGAFISYAHRYGEWVAVLQQNIQSCLQDAGADPTEVFLDQTDLASGRSWVVQLQEGLASSDHLILVATPEALASPRAENEWDAFINLRRDWAQGRFHVVMLVDVPLPPFLDLIQRLDFSAHDRESYLRELRKLVGGLLGRAAGDLPKLPDDLEIPPPPAGALPTKLRHRLVDWLAPQVERKLTRPAVATALGITPAVLEGYPTPEGAASAAIVAATGEDDRVKAGRRIVRALRDAFDEEDDALLAELDALARELESLGAGGGLLDLWLRRVARDHSNLVPFYESANLELLDRVYVQLELRPEERLRRGEEERALGLDRRHLTIRDLLALDPAKHPWVTRRWAVRGDPGAGKTTLLRHLAADLAAEPARRWVPVFESLPRLMRKPEWLLDRLERELRKAGEEARGLGAALEREGKEGRLLLLLDGLDEVPRDDRDDAEALLRDLSARWPHTPIVVTSRPIGFRRPGSEFVELDLLEFDADQRLEFLSRWFGRGSAKAGKKGGWRAAKVMKILRDDRGLWDLSGNPLYLTLMALLFEQKKTPERHRTALYDQVFDLLLDGRHRPGGKPIDAKKAVHALLRRLACDMTRDNRDSEPRAEIEMRLLRVDYDPLREPLHRVPAWERSVGSFLDDLAEKVGILGPHDGPTAHWRYWHRTFREALTAEQLAEELCAGGRDVILEKAREVSGDESRWAEPFALLVGRVEDPDSLVRSLVRANRALGLRAVATAQRLSDDTFRAVLNLTDSWTERRDVFHEIPDLIDDPERALALVDQLRQRTRNGNDLYFVGETVDAIAARWPEAERLTEALRGRFFDHIPPPAKDLFRWIETRDGRVELWREIPASESWTGAADGKEENTHERPRHRVKVTSSFWMAAVPVTNAQYTAFDPELPFENWEGVIQEELPSHPRVNITWYEAIAFCRWLSTHLAGARLPNEEEWEYASRAGTETRNSQSGQDLDDAGWYDENSQGRTHRVGRKAANLWQLYDIHGNVWEWTATEWDAERYKDRPSEEPYRIDPAAASAPPTGGNRVRRVLCGGSYKYPALLCRSAHRLTRNPWFIFRDRGFRVLLSSAPSSRTGCRFSTRQPWPGLGRERDPRH